MECVRHDAERAPHCHVAQAEQDQKAPMVWAPGRQTIESVEQGQGRRQHHGLRHDDPRERIEQQRNDHIASRDRTAQ
jgi:hypothetical protein